MRTIFIKGKVLQGWQGVEVWKNVDNDYWSNISASWSWSQGEHLHREVWRADDNSGSYWVPTSTNPPSTWDTPAKVIDTEGKPFDSPNTEYRPRGTYIWIPEDSFTTYGYKPGQANPNRDVSCHCPKQHPPQPQKQLGFTTAITPLTLLDEVLTSPPDQKAFQDSDGLISFVNLSSSFVTGSPQFTTGRTVCDKVSNFFATLRQNVFGFLLKNPAKVLPGDTLPANQWDPAVTHYMQWLLTQAGGLTNYHVTSETYSQTQVITEFSTAFIKLIFDAAVVPSEIITSVASFIQGVGQSLRASWDDRSRNYQTALLGQCHEAVPTDETGNTYIYFPKIKYYYISVDSSQQAFTSSCATVRKVTFNFKYESYVTALKASVLDATSSDYKSFVTFLDKAQAQSYKNATNNLDSILNDTSSASPAKESGLSVFGANLQEYPVVLMSPLANAQNGTAMIGELKTIEDVLNSRVV